MPPSFPTRLPRAAILSLLVGLAATPLLAQQAQQAAGACRLLQVPELEIALGGKASTKPQNSKQTVPGMTLDECTLVLTGGGQTHPVGIRIVTDIGMDGRQAITLRNTGQAREKQWTVPGAKLEQATVGTAICILTGRPSVTSHTVCRVPHGQGYVEVDVAGDVTALPSTATVGALAQKAAGRL